MGKGRSPCCDKAKVKRGAWSQAEDLKLISFIQNHGHSNWRALPKLAGLARCGKSCRLRWVNYLCPEVKRGNFTPQEEETIIKLHELLGNKWSKIVAHLPGRTDNEIKNIWNTHLKKRLTTKRSNSSITSQNQDLTSSTSSSSNIADSNREPVVSNSLESCDTNGTVTDAKKRDLREVIEIPFVPNLDLWDLLDADSSVDSDVHLSDVDVTKFEGGDKENDGGSWWWLECLENELGLEPTTTDVDTKNMIPGMESEPLQYPTGSDFIPSSEKDEGLLRVCPFSLDEPWCSQ